MSQYVDASESPRPRRGKGSRAVGVAISLGAHVGLALAILTARVPEMRVYETPIINLALVQIPPPAPPAVGPEPGGEDAPQAPPEPEPPKPEKKPEPPKAPPLRKAHRTPPPPVDADPLPAARVVARAVGDEVSDAALAGATTAGTGAGAGHGSGPGGGDCNMPGWLQQALRKDRRVQSTVAQAHQGRPILIWNGDWVRRADQEGAGLAAVREAMQWEIGFAPEACRNQRMRGLVLLTLNDGPASARLVLGSGGEWRWADMLHARGVRSAGLARD